MEGDLVDIAEMKLMHLAYSRPSQMLICADETTVYGIQISIKMHPAEDDDYPVNMDAKMK